MGVNTTFELPPGWEVKLIESNGRGYEVFQEEITTADQEIMIALAGQVVTTTGGTGFANADIHKSIRADLIQETADALAYTINTQGIPQYVIRHFGIDRLEAGGATVEWDVTPPKDVKQEAESLKAFGDALLSITTGLQPYKRAIDVGALMTKFGIPVAQDEDGDGNPENAAGVDEDPLSADEVDVDLTELDESSDESTATLQ
jgi:phage gp29-like protein